MSRGVVLLSFPLRHPALVGKSAEAIQASAYNHEVANAVFGHLSAAAVSDADLGRSQFIMKAFKNQYAGLGAPLTGDPDKFGLDPIRPDVQAAHKDHMHFQNNYPSLPLQTTHGGAILYRLDIEKETRNGIRLKVKRKLGQGS